MTTFILIHGSWHGAWCWYKITPKLKAAGHRVFVPDMPAHGKSWKIFRGFVTLNTMVKTITDILDSIDGTVVLVAHSRNGIVASRVAELRPNKVEKLIYLASFMLRNGEKALTYFKNDKESVLQGHVLFDRKRMTDTIDQRIYKEALYADCSDDDVSLAHALLIPEPSLPALTTVKLSLKNYGSIDRFYIELTQDCAVSLSAQRKFIAQSPCKKVFSLESSHSAYFSKPDELTEIILKINNSF